MEDFTEENPFACYVISICFLLSSPPFCFFSEDQTSKTPESTENRKEDEASITKSSSQIPAQPPVPKSPYGKGPPFNQVCWACTDPYHYQCFG